MSEQLNQLADAIDALPITTRLTFEFQETWNVPSNIKLGDSNLANLKALVADWREMDKARTLVNIVPQSYCNWDIRGCQIRHEGEPSGKGL